ncbi:MAG: Glu/Leu/Phe/Val dehydrogenase dimerization domain-containing protein [Candidatus Kariarchaeaceae archaeon]|jgi:glutamate dehydrogenase/leucine dehydrogenase
MVRKNSLVVKTYDPVGYIVIDDIRFPFSAGGIRLISGVNEKEVDELSKAMSLKLHSFELPISGAKGGVDSDNMEEFYNFIAKKEVKDLISGKSHHQLITGPDIGTSEEEYHRALRKAGLPELVRPGLLSKVSETFGLPFDNIITAYGAIVAAEEVLRVNKENDPLEGIRVAIEGFGKVGTGLAKLLNGRSKIVAISTRYGCITIENGHLDQNGEFKVYDLLKLQKEHGDRLIHKSGYTVHPTDYLFEVGYDLLIPGARTKVITSRIAQKIIKCKPRAIVPVANAPYTSEGLLMLEDAGILCFPDFISSAGAVIAAMLEFVGAGGEQEAMTLVGAAITWETRDLILEAVACSDKTKSILTIATQRAERKKNEILDKLLSDKEQYTILHAAKELILRYAPQLLSKT